MSPPKAEAPPCDTTTATPTLPPWREFFDIHTLSIPFSQLEATTRLKQNLVHFELNYLNVVLIIFMLHINYLCYTFFSDSTITSTLYFATIATLLFAAFYIKTRSPLLLALLVLLTFSTFVHTQAWFPLVLFVVFSSSIVCLHAVLRVDTFECDGLPNDAQPHLQHQFGEDVIFYSLRSQSIGPKAFFTLFD
uniref:PRA1 family protein n=1 Tax=Chenopodium quinoa TaxID=63459 RepID=A0A803M9L9_CHEQI